MNRASSARRRPLSLDELQVLTIPLTFELTRGRGRDKSATGRRMARPGQQPLGTQEEFVVSSVSRAYS